MITPIVVAGSMAAPADDTRPVRAEVAWGDDRVTLRLTGHSTAPIDVAYRVQATDGSNRVDQRGQATLREGSDTTLLNLSQSAGPAWSATVDVSGTGIASYQIVLRRP